MHAVRTRMKWFSEHDGERRGTFSKYSCLIVLKSSIILDIVEI